MRPKVLAVGTPAQLQQQYAGETLEDAFVACLQEAQGFSAEPHESHSTASEALTSIPRRGFSLRRTQALAVRESKELLRDPVRLAFALLGAVFMMIILGFGISLDVEDLAFATLDQDQSPQSRAYLEAFRGSRYFAEREPLRRYAGLACAFTTCRH